MGKRRVSVLGSEEEEKIKAEKAVKLEQKKLRQGLSAGRHGKTAKAPGLAGGQRIKDTSEESLRELEVIQAKLQPTTQPEQPAKKVKTRSKSYQTAKSQVDSQKTYSLADGLNLLRQTSLTKFDPAVELHLVLKSPSISKISFSLPHLAPAAKKVAVATDEVISHIEAGQIDFDILVASPAQMPKLVKLAKILGPRGLMPNPKTGTISDDPEATAKKLASDTAFTPKPDKRNSLVYHLTVGKLSLDDKKLSANIESVLSQFSNLKKAVLKSTMSPAIKLQI